MLQATPKSLPHRRGHAHKRSAAISGDFDLDFFKQTPSIGQQLSSSAPSTASFQQLQPPYLTPKTPNSCRFATAETPTFIIDEAGETLSKPHQKPQITFTSTPSPTKNHTRLNSWAHTSGKTKQKDLAAPSLEYSSSSSNENTPELKRQATDYSYDSETTNGNNIVPLSPPALSSYKIPEAIIDLDLASGIYHEPGTAPSTNKISRHRRTESAPELEDFLKYKIFGTNSSNKNSRRNSAIFEEEEEDDEDALSSTSSNLNLASAKNSSVNSLHSSSSNPRIQSFNSYQYPHPQSTLSTPTSVKTSSTATRRGASATRYQNYYNNNILLANAIKSSESLSHAVASNKSSMTSMNKNSHVVPSSSSSSSINSSSPSRFKFESQVYDIPSKDSTSSSRPETERKKQSLNNSKVINITPKKQIFKQHKKSNSLLNSISMKIRRNSSSSTTDKKRAASDNTTAVELDNDDEDFEGDSTITPFSFGEPGPELDLTTMTPRYHNDQKNRNHSFNYNNDINNTNNNDNSYDNESNEIFILSPQAKKTINIDTTKETPKKAKKTFFSWRKK